MVGRACLQEADEVKLIIVYIYWGLKKGEDKTDQNKASIASKYPSQQLYSFVCPVWPLQEAEL